MSIRQWLAAPFFLIQLLTEVSISLSHLLWKHQRPLLIFTASLAFFLVVLMAKIGMLYQAARWQANSVELPATQSLTPPTSTAQQQLATWEHVYLLQPTHRDVLLNLAQLETAVGDATAAAQSRAAATQVDPNSPLFN